MTTLNERQRKSSEVVATMQTSDTVLLTFQSPKPFEDVVRDFEKQLGFLDQSKALSDLSELHDAVTGMQGSSGLMIIAILEMDRLLPELAASGSRSRQYLVGNPLIADRMAKHHILATLFVPPRVLIYTESSQTFISYEQPSTTLGRLASPEILFTAKELDGKFEQLAKLALQQ